MAKNGRYISSDPASWPKMAATSVALPRAASAGFVSGELGISAALDAFSTVFELPLTRFENRQTDRQTNRHTDMNDHYTSLHATRHAR